MLAIALVGCSATTEIDRPALEFRKLSLGMQHTCGLTLDGVAYCWGEEGLLGTGNGSDASRPALVSGGRRYFDISTGSSLTCALDAADSTAYCWGRETPERTSLLPTQLSQQRFVSIHLAIYQLNQCARTAPGDVYCWGTNDYGQVGVGHRNPVIDPSRVSTTLVAAAAATQGAFACLLTSGGAAHCWGYNGQGQLGIADTAYTCSPVTSCAFPAPVPVKGNLTFASLALGGSNVCGITTGGSTYCWGSNARVGGAAATDTCIPIVPCNPAPALVSAPAAFVSIRAGAAAVCRITAAGKAYCWGDNDEAQLGTGDLGRKNNPTAVAGDIAFRALYPGIRHTCGIASDNRAYCWGNNIIGGLGIGSFGELYRTPQLVSGP